MTIRSLILGCSGYELTPDEIAFFKDLQPWGLILFKRNVSDPKQVAALCNRLREITGRDDTPILIDQEGGRVQRMGPPHWPVYPQGRVYGNIHAKDAARGLEAARVGARLMASDLRAVGINVDCLPVLDVPVPGAHDVIGNRAYGVDPQVVAALSRAAAEGLLEGSVLPVIKHIPGHGRAEVDSHLSLPVVDASLAELEQDFEPFRQQADMPLAMTAHVIYSAIDAVRPATISPVMMTEIIRGRLGFDGLVMSDDLSMQALSGTLRQRAEAAFAAGCDVALHCNGVMEEMLAVASAAPILASDAARRAEAALGRIHHCAADFDVAELRLRFERDIAAFV